MTVDGGRSLAALRRVSRRPAALVLALACLALAAACGDDPPAAPAGASAPTAPGPSVTVYFSDDAGLLRAESRRGAPGQDALAAALDALRAGPLGEGLVPALPAGTRVLSASVDGAVATVDLSRAFEAGYPPGGAAAELAVVGPLVRTVAGASGAEAVRVLVEGRVPRPVGSQIDFSEPLSADDVDPGG